MFYVYLLRSKSHPSERYTGFTTDLAERLKTHNGGGSPHTSKYRPWSLVAYFAFEDERKAREFEHYLKSGSGKAFANKRFGRRSLDLQPCEPHRRWDRCARSSQPPTARRHRDVFA
jgi:predicted GIY-YIG superfamily endonuclease